MLKTNIVDVPLPSLIAGTAGRLEHMQDTMDATRNMVESLKPDQTKSALLVLATILIHFKLAFEDGVAALTETIKRYNEQLPQELRFDDPADITDDALTEIAMGKNTVWNDYFSDRSGPSLFDKLSDICNAN